MDKKTPLYETHLRYGGKIVPFGGYLLPVQYKAGVIAEHMISSGISLPPASIITIFFSVAAMVQNISEVLRSALVGLIRYLPSLYPNPTPAIGPLKGISEMLTAAEAPIIAAISGEQS